MSLQEVFALLLVLAAAFTYVNDRFLRITPTIGIVVITLLIAASMLAIEAAGWTSGGRISRSSSTPSISVGR